MRKVTARVLTLALLVVTALVIPGIARADTITWDGTHGSQNLPCGSDVHWILADAKGVDSAELFVDGVDQGAMDPNPQGNQYSIFSDAAVDANTTVTAEITGTPDGTPFLTISDCAAPATTTTTTTTTTVPGNAPGTPNTGFNPLPFVAIGLVLLTGGAVVLRRKTI